MTFKLLIDKRGRKYLVEGNEIHTDLGIVKISGKKKSVKSHLGHEFAVLEPDIIDIYEKMPRSGSYMLKKDIALLINHLGIRSGSRVVDAGAGSGALAIFLGSLVGPEGSVATYEKNMENVRTAQKNIEKAGLQSVIEIKNSDVFKGFIEKSSSVDAVSLDLHEPWRILEDAYRILKTGRRIGVYTVYLEHARRVHTALEKGGFIGVKTIEASVREMEFRKQGSRPKTSRVGHSGYITFGRKLYKTT